MVLFIAAVIAAGVIYDVSQGKGKINAFEDIKHLGMTKEQYLSTFRHRNKKKGFIVAGNEFFMEMKTELAVKGLVVND